MLDRIQQGQPGNLTLRLVTPAGAPTDPTPDAATVRVVADDGTEVIPSVAANDSGTGVFSVPYTAANAALLDRWTAYWTITVNGQPRVDTTTHEVVGGFLFALAELAPSVVGATDAQMQRARLRVEQYFERTIGYALVPRYGRARLDGNGRERIRLRPELRRIRWATTTVAGAVTNLAPADIANLGFNSAGFVEGYWWPAGMGTVQIGYEHGLDRPEEPLVAAGLELAAFYQQAQPSTDPRAERLITDDGTLIFGANGVTPLPSVNAALAAYGLVTIA